MRIIQVLAFVASLLFFGAEANAGSHIYFEDSFDGEDLSPEWQVINPDPDAYLVENGVLTLLAQNASPATFDAAKNVLVLKKPVPKGDWTMTVRLRITPQTMGEALRIGVAKDAKNGLYAMFSFYTQNYVNTGVFLNGEKLAKGKKTSFYRKLYTISSRDIETRASVFRDNIKAVNLRLEKKGRQYIAGMMLEPAQPNTEGAPKGEWMAVQKLTSLRAPGDKFVLTFGSTYFDYVPKGGEGLIEIDSVTIEIPE